MKRDLVFFLCGLCFGVAAGFFLFRALSPTSGAGAVASRPPGVERSSIGLEEEGSLAELDEDEVRRLEAEATSRPEDAQVRAELGNLYMEAGRFDEAVRWLSEAVSLKNDDLHVRNHLAIALLNQGDLDGAVGTYEESLRIAPNDPASLLGLGRIRLYVQRDIRAGLELWETLMEVAPGSPEAESVREELEALQSAHEGS